MFFFLFLFFLQEEIIISQMKTYVSHLRNGRCGGPVHMVSAKDATKIGFTVSTLECPIQFSRQEILLIVRRFYIAGCLSAR